ncbi:MAG: hypothetical protein HW421_3042 [Ignavibacteria bacterium]|nr:hypothetical protein [Ignavibacteria bacterium]
MERINRFKFVLWCILGIASAVAITRLIFGLGATTNLTDNTPWGFWIGFDVMGGVALAAGGFVIAAFNYIFGKKKFQPIARAAILTAFLGYLAVVIGLLFDLGLPWNIWHMVIFWNPHSPLFEVGWCVMLYLAVLFLEFMPVILERFPNLNILAKLHHTLNKIRIPLVVLGIMLSTLHQSSLGSLFLTMPYRLHPLWWSPIIPLIFLVSAICLGLMMVIVESMTSSYLYKKEYETHILDKLSKIASFMLLFYMILRFSDIIIRGAAPFLFVSGWGTYLFWFELIVSIFVPLIIFIIPAIRKNTTILYIGAITGVMGIVFNRLNVGGLTHLNNLSGIGTFYFPSWMEISVSLGVVSLAMLLFFYFIENYKVWDNKPIDLDSGHTAVPKFNTNYVYLGTTKVTNRIKFTFAFVFAFGLAFAAISGEKVYGEGFHKTPVTKAKGGDTLVIDGNRDNYGVQFKHKFHSDSLHITCVTCHHLNKPKDKNTQCFECHNDMYLTGDAFRHDWHTSAQGANLDCFKCHKQGNSKGKEYLHNMKSVTDSCTNCHNDLIPANSKTRLLKTYKTVSYSDAMHNLCIGCHDSLIKSDVVLKARKPDLALCSNCHIKSQPYRKDKIIFEGVQKNKWVVLPGRIK